MDRKDQLKWLLRAHEAGLLTPGQSQALNTHFGLLKAKRDGALDEAGQAALAKGSFLDQARPDIGKAEAGARGAAQGLSLGFADEIGGALRGLLSDETMTSEIERSRVRDALAKMDEGGTYTGGEIGGTIAGALVPGGAIARVGKGGLSLGRRAATLAGAGAVQEGARGAGLAEGDKAEGALQGALAGAAVGGALPVAGAGLRHAIGPGSLLRNAAQHTALDAILPGAGTGLAIGRGAKKILNQPASASAAHGRLARPLHRVASEYASRHAVPIDDVLNPKLKRSFAPVRPGGKQRAQARAIDVSSAGAEAAEIAARLASGEMGILGLLAKNIGGAVAVKAGEKQLSKARRQALAAKLRRIDRMPAKTPGQVNARFDRIEDLLKSLTSRERRAVLRQADNYGAQPLTQAGAVRGLGAAGIYGTQQPGGFNAGFQ